MSLRWDARNVKNYEELSPDTTQAMVFECMITGIGEITEKNADKFYIRSKMISTAHGQDSGITLETVHAYIGLRTNVFPERTDAAFRKQVMGALQDRATRELNDELHGRWKKEKEQS